MSPQKQDIVQLIETKTPLMTLSIGESDSGPGASTPDEPVPGQTHDHQQWRNLTQRRTDTVRQHSPLPHPAELFPRYSSCGGKLSAAAWLCVVLSHPNGTLCGLFCIPPLICLHVSPQVEASASNLNTNDVFVLKSPSALFVWRGMGASDEEMQASKHVVGFLGGSASQVTEGKEPGEFITLAKQCSKPSYSEVMAVAFSPLRWFLDCPWWQKGLPDLQESAGRGQTPTSVWLLQQNWKTYCKSLTVCATRKSFHLVHPMTSLTLLLHCLSGWRSTRRLHSVWPGNWWCHAPGYLGPGKPW